MTTGERIKRFRKMRCMTQKELAVTSGMSEPAIRNYELGNRTPSTRQLEKIALALNISRDALIVTDIVRCDECKHYRGLAECELLGKCGGTYFFCAWGEEKKAL